MVNGIDGSLGDELQIGRLIKAGADSLAAVSPTPVLEARLLLCHAISENSLYILANPQGIITKEQCGVYLQLIKRRENSEPIAYITGKKEFMSLELTVRPGVLIPRPDTEVLTEYIIKRLKNTRANILELCTGSGCIAIALAHYMPDCKVTAVDISDTALEVAEENIKKHGLLDRIALKKVDILSQVMGLEKVYDAIVSNPPYIETNEIALLEADVKDYEPTIALDGGVDGLIFYRRIIELSHSLLKPKGLLVFEVGQKQARSVFEFINNAKIDIIKDLSGIERVVAAELKT